MKISSIDRQDQEYIEEFQNVLDYFNENNIEYTTNFAVNPQVIAHLTSFDGENLTASIIYPFDYHDKTLELAFLRPKKVDVILEHASAQEIIDRLCLTGLLRTKIG